MYYYHFLQFKRYFWTSPVGTVDKNLPLDTDTGFDPWSGKFHMRGN